MKNRPRYHAIYVLFELAPESLPGSRSLFASRCIEVNSTMSVKTAPIHEELGEIQRFWPSLGYCEAPGDGIRV
jgi:hypothetical protein